ncbi:MAG TPA: DUF924 family protein [Steroidobacteraceae bacterium]|nr:DUF924 family protein [Steroidobacteraceae bacterium]
MNDSGQSPEPRLDSWVGQVLSFWFSDLDEADWWKKDPALDEKIRSRFLGVHERLVESGAIEVTRPRPILAAVIVLDQFSRNMFRDSTRAFASDPIARRLAREAIDQGYDQGMRAEERMFLYLPFEHSEDRADQELSVELFSRLGRDDWTRFAIAHKVIIDRFGRFPHRNAVLGRVSSPEEIEVMRQPMGSF